MKEKTVNELEMGEIGVVNKIIGEETIKRRLSSLKRN